MYGLPRDESNCESDLRTIAIPYGYKTPIREVRIPERPELNWRIKSTART